MIPLFINCRDRCDTVMAMVEWAQRLPDVAVFLVDNASTYPPLLEFYATTAAKVLYAGENGGPRTPHRFVAERLNGQQFFAITDCDLDLSTVPTDVVAVCAEILLNQETLVKVGCALSLQGLPSDHLAVSREAEYWEPQHRHNVNVGDRWLEAYAAPIDTTFAVYRADGPQGCYEPALRLAGEYAAIHRPWHYRPDTLPDDERYYLERMSTAGIFYSARLQAELLA